MADEGRGDLSFPDLAKLELDELIDQLVERAHGVKRAQGRLRALLRAIEIVTGELSLEAVLRNVVDAACELSGAAYAALGVVGYDGGLEQFIHVGMDELTVHGIGHLPEGKGLLGALITDPRPIRLEHMTDDTRSAGFPAGHPPMDSFLGVPIRVRDEVYGNLYLTDSDKGEFSADDEELVKAVALAAGTAISNARLYQESRLQQRWLSASVEIGAQLLSPAGEDPLRMIARRSFDLADADLVSVGLLTPDRTSIVVEVAIGEGSDDLVGARFLLSETLAGRAVEQGSPLLLDGDTEEQRSHLASVMEPGPLMVLPLAGTQMIRGVLTVARRKDKRGFGAADLRMAAGFASHASVALELADARSAEQRILLLEDRERIARDLHDHVIQELFGIGLGLESATMLLGADHPVSDRVQQRIGELDRTIRRIRTSIFELRGPLLGTGDGIRQRILAVSADLTPALGFAPRVTFSGLVDIVLDGELGDDVVATCREALANVAKHAHAGHVDVDVAVSAQDVTLAVTDDGVGIDEPERVSGLDNLRQRAAKHGGSFEITNRRDSGRTGTTLTWKALVR